MYCFSCGKQIADESQFCMHCGKSLIVPDGIIAPTTQPTPKEWEYKDFEYKWSPGDIYTVQYELPTAREHFWQEYQRQIKSELQKWLDEGWEPVGEVGPASIEIREYRGIKLNPFGWLIAGFLALLTVGLALILFLQPVAEPTVFRLTMRRPKT